MEGNKIVNGIYGSEAVLDTMLGKLEVPQLGEAHEVVYSV